MSMVGLHLHVGGSRSQYHGLLEIVNPFLSLLPTIVLLWLFPVYSLIDHELVNFISA